MGTGADGPAGPWTGTLVACSLTPRARGRAQPPVRRLPWAAPRVHRCAANRRSLSSIAGRSRADVPCSPAVVLFVRKVRVALASASRPPPRRAPVDAPYTRAAAAGRDTAARVVLAPTPRWAPRLASRHRHSPPRFRCLPWRGLESTAPRAAPIHPTQAARHWAGPPFLARCSVVACGLVGAPPHAPATTTGATARDVSAPVPQPRERSGPRAPSWHHRTAQTRGAGMFAGPHLPPARRDRPLATAPCVRGRRQGAWCTP